jgi:hypothetical protein
MLSLSNYKNWSKNEIKSIHVRITLFNTGYLILSCNYVWDDI